MLTNNIDYVNMCRLNLITVLLSSRKVLVFFLQEFTSPCACPRTTSPCPWTTKSLKIAFCKKLHHVKSINSITAIVNTVTVKNG